MDEHERRRRDESERPARAVTSPQQAIALQRTVSNAALSRMLHRTPAPAPAHAKTEERISELEAHVKRLENKQRAMLHLDGFRDDVMDRVTGWERAILNLGTAYATAAKNHIDAVEAKKKVDAIKSQAMFSVLTIASAGGLAWVSGAAQAAKGAADEGGLLTNVLEDVLQTGAAEILSANGPGVARSA